MHYYYLSGNSILFNGESNDGFSIIRVLYILRIQFMIFTLEIPWQMHACGTTSWKKYSNEVML